MFKNTSTLLSTAEYDEANTTLILNFQNGARYTYIGVPADVFAALLKAESPGTFFQNAIRPNYGGVKAETTNAERE